SSKSPSLELRTITSPITVVVALRYINCPVRVCQSAVGCKNWCVVVVAQLTRARTGKNCNHEFTRMDTKGSKRKEHDLTKIIGVDSCPLVIVFFRGARGPASVPRSSVQ